jgi:hydroxymethylglutaryl-CoA synthase
MPVGIVGYGISLPSYRVRTLDIQKTWNNMSEAEVKALRLPERGVLSPDEDTVTLAWDASRRALEMADVPLQEVGALYLGTQTSPYVSKASASCLVDMLGIGPEIMCGDCQFSGKSGTMALQTVMALVQSGIVKYGLAVGADALSLHFDPGNPMEYMAASGAAAFVIGTENVLASLDATASCASDTSDYWRLDGDRYFMWGGQAMTSTDVGMPSHIVAAVGSVLAKANLKTDDIAAVAAQQANGSTTSRLARILGLPESVVAAGAYAGEIGDCGAASPLVSLVKILQTGEAKQRLLLVSYGWGAGSDAFVLTIDESNAVKKSPHSDSR